MIQINELRIGNLIEINGENAKVEVIDNDLDEVYFIGKYFYYGEYCSNIKPIILTDKWLLKLGYTASEKNEITIKSYFYEKGNHKIWYPYDQFLDDKYRFEIKYVHQLQNLYFALTGAELTVA